MEKDDLYDFGLSKSGNKIANRFFFQTMMEINTPCDFNYWEKRKLWTIDEASVICLGIEPRKFLYIESLYFSMRDKKQLVNEKILIFQNIAEITCKRTYVIDELKRAYVEKEIDTATKEGVVYIESLYFCYLCMQRGIDIPKQLIEFSKSNTPEKILWENAINNEECPQTKKILRAYFYKGIGKSWKEIANELDMEVRSAMRLIEKGKGDATRLAKGLPKIPLS